jgi:hypothetical protein
MVTRSVKIRDRLFECIDNYELETDDLVKIVERIANDILKAKTKTNFTKSKISKITGRNKSYNAWSHAHAITLNINGKIFLVDNE